MEPPSVAYMISWLLLGLTAALPIAKSTASKRSASGPERTNVFVTRGCRSKKLSKRAERFRVCRSGDLTTREYSEGTLGQLALVADVRPSARHTQLGDLRTTLETRLSGAGKDLEFVLKASLFPERIVVGVKGRTP